MEITILVISTTKPSIFSGKIERVPFPAISGNFSDRRPSGGPDPNSPDPLEELIDSAIPVYTMSAECPKIEEAFIFCRSVFEDTSSLEKTKARCRTESVDVDLLDGFRSEAIWTNTAEEQIINGGLDSGAFRSSLDT
jgi:hypothetical protein